MIDLLEAWKQLSGVELTPVEDGGKLKIGERNFIKNTASNVFFPDHTKLKEGAVLTTVRGAMKTIPTITADSRATIFYKDDGVGAAFASPARIPFSDLVEVVWIWNGRVWQTLPNTARFDTLANGMYSLTFSANGQFTVPADNNLSITVVGGGGDGGESPINSGNSFHASQGGGSAAAVLKHSMTLPVGTVVDVVVGAVSGTSKFGDYVICTGGKKGSSEGSPPEHTGEGGVVQGSELANIPADKKFNGARGGSPGASAPLGTSGGGSKGGDVNGKKGGDGAPAQTHYSRSYAGAGGGAASAVADGGDARPPMQISQDGKGPGAGGAGRSADANIHNGKPGKGKPGIVIITWGPAA